MDRCNLTEIEMNIINSFLDEIINISSTEAVYLTTYFDTKSCKHKLVVIYNNSSDYIKDKKISEKEIKTLNEIINKYNTTNESISFELSNAKNYNKYLMNRKEVISERNLVSGTILFDRFGEISDNKKLMSNYMRPYKNTVITKNINDVVVDLKKKKISLNV